MAKKWIQRALKAHHKGTLHRELGLSPEEHIPVMLLNSIKNSKIGDYIMNGPKPKIKVTRLLKRRAVLALNLEKTKH